jgi:hypothetical protein
VRVPLREQLQSGEQCPITLDRLLLGGAEQQHCSAKTKNRRRGEFGQSGATIYEHRIVLLSLRNPLDHRRDLLGDRHCAIIDNVLDHRPRQLGQDVLGMGRRAAAKRWQNIHAPAAGSRESTRPNVGVKARIRDTPNAVLDQVVDCTELRGPIRIEKQVAQSWRFEIDDEDVAVAAREISCRYRERGRAADPAFQRGEHNPGRLGLPDHRRIEPAGTYDPAIEQMAESIADLDRQPLGCHEDPSGPGVAAKTDRSACPRIGSQAVDQRSGQHLALIVISRRAVCDEAEPTRCIAQHRSGLHEFAAGEAS